LREEVERLGLQRPLFISTPGRRKDANKAARDFIGMTASVYAEAVMHVPIETVQAAREAIERHNADGVIAFGGGSAIDTSQAVGLQLGIRITTHGQWTTTAFGSYWKTLIGGGCSTPQIGRNSRIIWVIRVICG
jgi:alcohol dehydrogenase class IV